MFDIAWSEMLVIMVVALVVIGPKDLPRLIREVGRWTAKARGMAREFQRSFDDMVREAELDDIKKGFEATRPANIVQSIRDAVDPGGELERSLEMTEQRDRPTPTTNPDRPTSVVESAPEPALPAESGSAAASESQEPPPVLLEPAPHLAPPEPPETKPLEPAKS